MKLKQFLKKFALIRFNYRLLRSIQFWFNNRILNRLPSNWLRKFILRLQGMRIGSKVVLYGGFEIRSPRKINVGEGTIIGFRCVLDGRMGLTIGENVNIGNDVMLWTLQHDYNDPGFGAVGSSIVINDRAWLSTRSIILPGRNIGIGSVVAANCVVTRNTDDYTVVGGSPMKILRQRSKDISYVFSGKSDYWFV